MKIFQALCWENPCFMLGQTPYSQLFQPNAEKILALCWENSCLAPEFDQSHLQCNSGRTKPITKLSAFMNRNCLDCYATLMPFLTGSFWDNDIYKVTSKFLSLCRISITKGRMLRFCWHVIYLGLTDEETMRVLTALLLTFLSTVQGRTLIYTKGSVNPGNGLFYFGDVWNHACSFANSRRMHATKMRNTLPTLLKKINT